MIKAPRRLDAVPKPGVAGRHFRNSMTRSQLLAQLAIGAVGHPGHGGDKNRIREDPGANLHAGILAVGSWWPYCKKMQPLNPVPLQQMASQQSAYRTHHIQTK